MIAAAFRWIRNTPSAVILAAQLAAVILYPFLDGYTNHGKKLNDHLHRLILGAFRALVESYGGTVCR